MEILLKVAVTAVVICLIYYQVVFLRTLWRSQLDPGTTFSRVLGKFKPQSDIIAIREPNKIYQNGQVVGEVLGRVEAEGNRVKFQQLVNTTGLRADQPVEYQRTRLRIVSVKQRTGVLQNMTDEGTFVYRDVLGEVECELVP